MGVGRISPNTLTDIANAIRWQNGTSELYTPRQMAAAVRALDGSNAGGTVEMPYTSYPSGVVTVVSESALGSIANAIRSQNGLDARYYPREMAQAIRDLEWDVGLKPRAVLLSDGTLEFNYFERRRAASAGTVVTAFEVATGGYSGATSRPWDSVKQDVVRVVIDPSFASVGVTSCAYWFSGFSNLVEVRGLESVSGITNATQMFTSCPKLETIYATSFSNSAITSSGSMFYGCVHLVGGTDGFVPATTSNANVCKLGAGGVLTDPDSDAREWFNVYVFADGRISFTRWENPEWDELLASGRLCANAKYNAAGIIPGYAFREQFRTVVFDPSMSYLPETNMNYWFYGLGAITSFVGIGNLENVKQMRYAFSSCTGVTMLDFRGFDPSHLTDLFYAFAGCSALVTIKVSSSWALPSSGISGTQTFYNCGSLVGGNGTTYASNRTSYTYMRIDAAGSQGYLTAA